MADSTSTRKRRGGKQSSKKDQKKDLAESQVSPTETSKAEKESTTTTSTTSKKASASSSSSSSSRRSSSKKALVMDADDDSDESIDLGQPSSSSPTTSKTSSPTTTTTADKQKENKRSKTSTASISVSNAEKKESKPPLAKTATTPVPSTPKTKRKPLTKSSSTSSPSPKAEAKTVLASSSLSNAAIPKLSDVVKKDREKKPFYEAFFCSNYDGGPDNLFPGCVVISHDHNSARELLNTQLKKRNRAGYDRKEFTLQRIPSDSMQAIIGAREEMKTAKDPSPKTTCNLYICLDHHTQPMLPGGSLVVAPNRKQAVILMDKKLMSHGLKPYAKHPYTLTEKSLLKVNAESMPAFKELKKDEARLASESNPNARGSSVRRGEMVFFLTELDKIGLQNIPAAVQSKNKRKTKKGSVSFAKNGRTNNRTQMDVVQKQKRLKRTQRLHAVNHVRYANMKSQSLQYASNVGPNINHIMNSQQEPLYADSNPWF